MFQFSCLMSVYAKEKPDYLFQSLQSIKDQSIGVTELVVVEDGPLTPDLYKVLDQFSELNLKRIKLEQNLGLGLALGLGLGLGLLILGLDVMSLRSLSPLCLRETPHFLFFVFPLPS